MIEIRINKEIHEYEPKIIGPFTMRQCVCLAIGAPIVYGIFIYVSPILSRDIAGLLCVFPACFAWAFGWARPYGMKTEEFIRSVFVNRVLAPSFRKYKTENTVETILTELESTLPQDTEPKDKKKHKQKKKKYKRSEKAYL